MGNSKWYALYTKSRFEKKLSSEFTKAGYNIFLPTQNIMKQWSDRKKWVEVPLFKSYIFVLIEKQIDFSKVLNFNGAVSFVQFSKKPEPIKEDDINLIRKIVQYGNFNILEEYPEKLNIGEEVSISGGSFKDLTGELLRYKGEIKVLVKINAIDKNIIIDIPSNLIVKK